MFGRGVHPLVRRVGLPLAAGWLAWVALSVGRGEPPPRSTTKPAAPEARGPDAHRYLGVVACARCHRQPTPEDRDAKITDFVALTEYETWSVQDKHSRAFETLSNERSASIGKVLGIDPKTHASCLACHAVACPPQQRDASFRVERGVSCEACHGASSDWIDPHWKSGWRAMTPAAKESLGMIDVRSPARRTELCLSCHLGDVAAGKVVSHDIYAAGHPPLPSFEIESFTAVMPSHWRPLSAKSPEVQRQFNYQSEPLERTRQVLTGGLVSLRSELKMLGQAAASKDGPWPELSLYDCRACHHDLRSPGWRQRRGYRGTPGRATMPAWTGGLSRLGLQEAGDDSGLAKLQTALTNVNAQGFGDRAALGESTSAAIRELDGLLERLRAKQLVSGDARRLLKQLATLVAGESPDFESARQFAWAWQVIYGELTPKPASDAQAQAIFAAWSEQLATRLPIGRDKTAISVEPSALSIANNFDPAGFQSQVKKLAIAVGN